MISAVADRSKLQEEDIITAISSRSQRFRAMGWTPEQTITNIGRALSGLSPEESSKAMRGMFEAMESFDEAKARDMHVPAKIAESEQARLEWLKIKAAGLPVEQRNALLRQAFGPSYPYISKMLFEPTSPEMRQALEYAATPQAAAEEAARAAQYRETAEGTLERARGGAGRIDLEISRKSEINTAIREYGKAYIEYLKREKPLELLRLKAEIWPGGTEEDLSRRAAYELWESTHEERIPLPGGRFVPGYYRKPAEQRLLEVEQSARELHIHYHNDVNYNPVAGTAADRDIGPRADRDFK